MAIYLKITNPTEVVKKKTSKWLTDITPERIDRKLVEDEVIKGIIEQLTLEGIEGEISAINGFDVKNSTLITKNDFVIRKTKSCLLYTSPSPRDLSTSRMPSSA